MKGTFKLSHFFVTLCTLVLFSGTVWAQNLAVNGTIVDAQGQPVIGASVIEKGTSNGAVTDLNGAFAIRVKDGATLEVSCIGYSSQEVKAAASMKIVLAEDAEFLDEVVVVGFGTQKKENLTGAVASVNVNKALEGRPISDVGRGLQGSVPGMNVRIGTTDVGSEAVIRIRGQVGSYYGSASPLILLDNVEIPSLNLVNPEDIESISVLKDAASASIYGAKAAFGVILISSKKGAEKDNVKVTYSGNYSIQNLAKPLDTGGVDGLHYTVQAFERSGGTVAGYPWYVTRSSYEAALAWQEKYGSTLDANAPLVYGRDYYYDGSRIYGVRTYNAADYMVRKNAPTTNHNVSVAGNKGKTTYNVSLGYMLQNGMSKASNDDSFTRWNANVRVNTQIKDWLNVHSGIMFTKSTKKYAYNTAVGNADPWYYLYRWADIIPQMPQDGYGNYLRGPAGEQALANTATHDTFYTAASVGTTITPLKNWNINIDYTYAVTSTSQIRPGTRFFACDTWSAPDAVPGEMIANEWNQFNGLGTTIQNYQYNPIQYTSPASGIDHIRQSASEAHRNTINATTTYDLELGQNQFGFMLGLNSVGYDSESVWAQKMGLMDIRNPQFSLATGTMTNGGSQSWSSTLGYFGRINYNYKERYLLEGNLRYDGSSKFPTALKWRWFPSVSAGWRVTEEPWMQGMKDVISLLKLRGSWGSIGDQTIGSSYYIPTMSGTESSWIHNDAKDTYYGTPAAVATDITWQDIETLDFGIDATLFHALGITFDWYQRDTKNMIVPGPGVGYTFGTTSPKGNYGSLRTNGWELSLNWGKSFSNGLGVNLTATLADAVTKVTEYGDAKSISGWYNGKTYGEIWGFKSDGLFQNDDFARDTDGNLIIIEATDAVNPEKYQYRHYQFANGKNYALQGKYNASSSVMFGPGDTRYLDLDGNGYIDTGEELVDDHGDLTVIGNTTPRYEYSFRVDLDYKGFDFSMFWQGIGKRDMWGSSSLTLCGFNSSDGATTKTFANNFWYEEFDKNGNLVDSNYDAFYPRAYNLGGGTDSFSMKVCDRYLLNMAYLRLKNVTLGYTLPARISTKAGIDKLRVYCSLENFLTFDHLNGLPVDPEVMSGRSALLDSDYNSNRAGVSTPAFKTASIGVQITL